MISYIDNVAANFILHNCAYVLGRGPSGTSIVNQISLVDEKIKSILVGTLNPWDRVLI